MKGVFDWQKDDLGNFYLMNAYSVEHKDINSNINKNLME